MPGVVVQIDVEQLQDCLPALAEDLTPHLNLGGGGPHTHAISDVTSLQTSLDSKASSTHEHTAGEVTGLAQVATTGDGGHLTAASVTNARLADMATGTIKGCVSGNRPVDLTAAQVAALLGGPTVVPLLADVTNANAVANTLADVTGMSFPVVAGGSYWYEFTIAYTAAATTTGSRWVLNGPAVTALNHRGEWTLTATSVTVNCASAYNIPAACNATSLATGNIATLWGVIRPSANGTVQLRFASEVANSAITAKIGSTLRCMRTI